jgi:hypothetical protein
MTLRNRAATALDLTHEPALAYRGPLTMQIRAMLAAWLDGKKIRISIIRKSVAYLEMVAEQSTGRAA